MRTLVIPKLRRLSEAKLVKAPEDSYDEERWRNFLSKFECHIFVRPHWMKEILRPTNFYEAARTTDYCKHIPLSKYRTKDLMIWQPDEIKKTIPQLKRALVECKLMIFNADAYNAEICHHGLHSSSYISMLDCSITQTENHSLTWSYWLSFRSVGLKISAYLPGRRDEMRWDEKRTKESSNYFPKEL